MRRRSLNKDVNDWTQFRHHRDRHMGFSVSTEFYQPVPFFFTREGANLNLIGHYRGGSIFIICNGPSLVSGKYDLSLLKRPGVMTYGMNNGARTIRPNFWTCVDDPKRFIKSIWLDPCIAKFVPHAHAEKRIFDNEQWQDADILVGQCPNVIYYHRNEKFVADRFLFEDTINWGNSGDEGGGRSVMLPVFRICFLLGFRTIYLLGADFKMSQNYTYHFDEQREKGAVNCNLSTYDRLKNEYLPQLAPYLEAEGVQVFNCNPESELLVFPHMPFEQAIANATSGLGDVDNERTWGMYSKPSERQKWAVQPGNERKGHLVNIQNRPLTPVSAPFAVSPVQIPSSKPIPNIPKMPLSRVEEHEDEEENINVQKPRQVPSANIQPFNPISAQRRIPSPPSSLNAPRPMRPMQPSQTVPPKKGTDKVEGGQRRVIRSLPCGMVSDGSSDNPSTQNATIKDDGNRQ